MAVPAERRATFEELYQAIQALPEGITGEILSDGVIETMGRPGRAHTRASKRLGAVLASMEAADESSGWIVEPEREVRLRGTRLVVPDLAGWRIEDGDTDFLDENPILRRPDWMCEILSDSTRKKDRTEKLPLYVAAGVPHVWLVEPGPREIEVYVGRWDVPALVARGDERARLPPFDLDIDLATLWVPRRKG